MDEVNVALPAVSHSLDPRHIFLDQDQVSLRRATQRKWKKQGIVILSENLCEVNTKTGPYFSFYGHLDSNWGRSLSAELRCPSVSSLL